MTNRKKIVAEIARDLNLKDAVVEAVVDRFIDYAVEETVREGSFRIPSFLTISSKEYRGYRAGGATNKVVPPTVRLKVSVSDGVRKLFQHQQKNGAAQPVTRDNWRGLIGELRGARRAQTTRETAEDWNPLLDEDD